MAYPRNNSPRDEMMEQMLADEKFHQEQANEGYGLKNIQAVSSITSQHPTIIHEQLENEKLIRNIEMRLRGMKYDFETGKIIYTGFPLIPSTEGVEKILAVIQTHLDKVQSISDLTDEEIYSHMLDFSVEVTLFLSFEGYHLYGIKKGDVFLIARMITNPIFFNWKRSRGGRQLDAISTIERVVQNQQIGQNKPGILARLGLKL